jgi:ribosomal protein S12 methylthiotransferase accessory factor
LADALDLYGRAVSPLTGVVRQVLALPPLDRAPAVHYAAAVPAQRHVSGARQVAEGAGASNDPRRATVKALGESLERYAAAFPATAAVHAAAGELTGHRLDPGGLLLYSAEQYAAPGFPYRPAAPDLPLGWEAGRRLGRTERCWVPAGLTRLPHRRAPGEARLAKETSTGLAAAVSASRATVSAVLELVERHAFMKLWRYGDRSALIEQGSVHDPDVRSLLARVRQAGYRCSLLRVGDYGRVSVVLAFAVPEDRRPPLFALGAGTACCDLHAARSAVEELCLNIYGLLRLIEQGQEPGLTTLAGQSLLFAVDETAAAEAREALEESVTARTRARGGPRCPSLGPGELTATLDPLTGPDSPVCVVDVTPSDLRLIGVHVHRAVAPGLLLLEHDSSARFEAADLRHGPPVRTGAHPFP